MKNLVCYFIFSLVFINRSCLSEEDPLNNQPEYTYYLSIVGFFQNEAPYLKEWIEYHRLLGVEHFYLYNDQSEDDYEEILDPYIREGIVELFDSESRKNRKSHVGDQTKAYRDCLSRSIGKTKWLAIIDLDEFILPKKTDSLVTFLNQFDDRPEIGGIEIAWQLFGTSGFKKLPTDSLMIENLTWKAPVNYRDKTDPDNTRVKSILRPEAVDRVQIHKSTCKEGFIKYPEKSHKLDPTKNYDEIQINHYWTRDEEFFYNVKIARRLTTMSHDYEANAIKKLEHLNQVQDFDIFKYVPELKKKLNSR